MYKIKLYTYNGITYQKQLEKILNIKNKKTFKKIIRQLFTLKCKYSFSAYDSNDNLIMSC